MTESVRIELQPLGEVLDVKRGARLQDVLFARGVEFPCGGRGRCKGCKIKVVSGSLEVSPEERQQLSPEEVADGWRLACRARAEEPLVIELAQWEATVLTDDSVFDFTPSTGLGIAIDLGTTTIAAQLLDLQTGQVLAIRTGLNAQAKHGADIMSRVEFGLTAQGPAALQKAVRDQLGQMCAHLLSAASVRKPGAPLGRVVLAGNTVMHHIFSGLELEPLSHVPFETRTPGLQVFSAADLGWDLPEKCSIEFLPCLGGFVGSDILAGILATRMHESGSLTALLDLGTNGEIVLGNRERLLCASTAAGPAFEGARIAMGMRAATGAISEARAANGTIECRVLGNGKARGICGSGLVDAVAAALDLGWIQPNGRLTNGEHIRLAEPVFLTGRDVRELQLAKGAIAAGLQLLLEKWGAKKSDLHRVYLAGAFGNYINQDSARRIGLLDFPAEKVQAAGNTALLGAKLALFGGREQDRAYPALLERVQHVSLSEDAHFQQAFVEQMAFPAASCASGEV